MENKYTALRGVLGRDALHTVTRAGRAIYVRRTTRVGFVCVKVESLLLVSVCLSAVCKWMVRG